jgi:hypothetical protein
MRFAVPIGPVLGSGFHAIQKRFMRRMNKSNATGGFGPDRMINAESFSNCHVLNLEKKNTGGRNGNRSE